MAAALADFSSISCSNFRTFSSAASRAQATSCSAADSEAAIRSSAFLCTDSIRCISPAILSSAAARRSRNSFASSALSRSLISAIKSATLLSAVATRLSACALIASSFDDKSSTLSFSLAASVSDSTFAAIAFWRAEFASSWALRATSAVWVWLFSSERHLAASVSAIFKEVWTAASSSDKRLASSEDEENALSDSKTLLRRPSISALAALASSLAAFAADVASSSFCRIPAASAATMVLARAASSCAFRADSAA
mmetsp:Transcript_39763/g.62059  ORF Transcript_39763/g.62059 Transcript_39763/m.62059 type:complete len:255 (+) Transcript_39763:701-1465(+)